MFKSKKYIILSILESPLLHFIIIGVVVYGLYTRLKPLTLDTIQVTPQTLEALIQQQESITQNPLTHGQKQALLEGHIEDEILLREAYKRGIHQNDYRVRKRLLTIMRSSLSDTIPEPSVAQLRAFYETHQKQYQMSPSRSFEQVYFSFVSGNSPKNLASFQQKLQNTSDISSLGEFFPMGQQFSQASFSQIAQMFGKPFAQAVFDLEMNTWVGPIDSKHGTHYVRVTAQDDTKLPTFEQMESYLRTDYFMEKSRESQKGKIDNMRKNYRIIVEEVEPRK